MNVNIKHIYIIRETVMCVCCLLCCEYIYVCVCMDMNVNMYVYEYECRYNINVPNNMNIDYNMLYL